MSYQQPYGYPGPALQTQVVVQPYRCSTAHVVIAWVCAVVTLGYLLPWAIAATRNRRNVAAIALIDLFLGWSLVAWVIALVMACGSDQPIVTVHTTYGPPMLLPAQTPPPPWAQPQPWSQVPRQQPYAPPAQQQPWEQAPPQPYVEPQALPARPYTPPEPTRVDPFGSEPTRQLPRSPWEPDHRR